MRPLNLVTRGLGAYAGEQVLDFRKLGPRSLFLIHGPTGSGKTTVLDAICYALYGVCSGGDRDLRRIRSDHADASVLTEVTLDFSLGSEAYRVYRRPEQERPKKRGAGTTTARSEATLTRRTGLPDHTEGTVVATQWDKVTEAVEVLLGFRSDQFRQVVVLPQGQFRRLLMADSKERQAILEVLFQTELYRRIEEALKQAAKEVQAGIENARSRRQFILDRAGATAREELAEQQNAATARLGTIRENLVSFKESEKTAQETLVLGQRVLEKLTELEASEKALRELEQQISAFGKKRELLERSRKAESILVHERVLLQRNEEANRASQSLEQARKTLVEAQAAIEGASRRFEVEAGRAEEREAAQKSLNRLEDLTQRVRDLHQVKAQVASAQEKASAAATGLSAAREALEDCDNRIVQNRKALEETEKTGAQAELLHLRVEEAVKALANRKRMHGLELELRAIGVNLDDTASRVRKAEEARDKVQSELRALETAWFDGQAAILASRLAPGSPCPVCGSTDHPAPAHSVAALPDEKAIKKKRTDLEKLKEAVAALAAEQTDLEKQDLQVRTSVASLAESLGDLASKPVLELECSRTRVAKELKEAQQAQKQCLELSEKAAALDKIHGECRKNLKRAEEASGEAGDRLSQAKGEVAARSRDIPEELQDPEALERRKKAAKRMVRKLKEALDKAQDELAQAKERFSAAEAALKAAEDVQAEAGRQVIVQREEFARSLQDANFRDEAEYKASKRSRAEMEKLGNEILAFDRALGAAGDRVKRAQEAAEGLERPDVDALETAAKHARGVLEAALKESAALEENIKRKATLLHDFDSVSGTLATLEAQYAVVGRISQVASGSNHEGITFQRFVLAALLDEVLFAASKRLVIMSNGRFRLQRLTGRTDRRIPGGLDLEVSDTYTGTTRPVSTLSGGESFLASLSLALGLADVVQTRSGGIHLDTIFVDEGFGSLDPEALDLAFRALVDLQRDGRLVGIISHVPELRDRIDARLEVKKGRRGSTAAFVVD